MGLPAGRGTKFAGTRAGLLFPDMPGMSNVSSTSGPNTNLLSGALPGLPEVNFVVRTNDTIFCDVDWANEPLTASSRRGIMESGEKSFLIFNSLIEASINCCWIQSTGGRRPASILQQLSQDSTPPEGISAANPCQTRNLKIRSGVTLENLGS